MYRENDLLSALFQVLLLQGVSANIYILHLFSNTHTHTRARTHARTHTHTHTHTRTHVKIHMTIICVWLLLHIDITTKHLNELIIYGKANIYIRRQSGCGTFCKERI